MSDVEGSAPEQDDTAAEDGAPLTPEARITALEQLVVPMFKDWASALVPGEMLPRLVALQCQTHWLKS